MATILRLSVIAGAAPRYEFTWKARGKRETESVRQRLLALNAQAEWEGERHVWRVVADARSALALALCFQNFWQLRDLLPEQPGLFAEAT